MRRRGVMRLLGGAGAAWALSAQAQQVPLPIVGFLNPGSAADYKGVTDAFRQGLAEVGYLENRNVKIEYRWADGRYDQLAPLAVDLVHHRADVIAALGSSEPARAAQAATSTHPIVFQTGGDPVEDGLVSSMNRPDGNMTGVTRMTVATDSKRLAILHDLVPSATTIGCMINPTSSRWLSQVRQIEHSARVLGLTLHLMKVGTTQDLDAAFAAMLQAGAAALLLAADAAQSGMYSDIAELTVKHQVPAVSSSRLFVSHGGLMSYDASLTDSYRQAGMYVGRILKGEKPADLPVLQPTKFELVINLKTARAVGLAIPDKLLALADEVIE